MKKLTLTVLSIALLSGGWFLEVYYYQFRFVGDGTPFWIAIIIGVSLTLFLSSLFINMNKKKYMLSFVLILFSMFYTMSGQNYSYSKSQNANSTINSQAATIQNKYDYYTVRINETRKSIQYKDSILPDDIKDRTYLNKNGVQPLLKEINGLKEELEILEGKRDHLDLGNVEIVSLSAYEMLANDLGLSSPTPLKLISQAVLSLFIALMAPSGIRILSNTYHPTPPKKTVKTATKAVKNDELTIYSNSRFRGLESPTTLKGRAGVVEEIHISFDRFNKYSTLEKKLNLVESTGNSSIPLVTRSEFIKRMYSKKSYSGNLVAVK